MAVDNIHVDDFGWLLKLRIVQDGSAVDISSYTTRSFILRDPTGTTATKTATFTTDGSDGWLQYTTQDGDVDRVGMWSVAARISKTGTELTSEAISFPVLERVD